MLGPSGRTVWRQDELRDGTLVVLRTRHEGARFDDTLYPETSAGSTSLRFVLGAPLVVRAGARLLDLGTGRLDTSSEHGASHARSLGTSSDVLTVGWRVTAGARARLPGGVDVAPSASVAARLRAFAELLSDPQAGPHALGPALDDVRAALASEGLDVPPRAAAGAPPCDLEVAAAVQRIDASLPSHPTSVDLARALGVGEPHAVRRANAFFRRYYLCADGWRGYLRDRRLGHALFSLGHPRARTDEVARALGYRSATSLCHAFQRAGLPSPRAVQRELLVA